MKTNQFNARQIILTLVVTFVGFIGAQPAMAVCVQNSTGGVTCTSSVSSVNQFNLKRS